MQSTTIWKLLTTQIAQVLFMSFLGLTTARAEPVSKQCSTLEQHAAEGVAGTLATWRAVHDAYIKFAHCDDGSIGQGFSESITTLLASQWSQFEELDRFAKHDKGFEAFVLRHIDATVPLERLDIVRNNASRLCKSGVQLCKKIAKSAASAWEEGRAAQ